jgi:hypothetical protein
MKIKIQLELNNENKCHWYHRNLRICGKGLLMSDSLSVLCWIERGLPVRDLESSSALTGTSRIL